MSTNRDQDLGISVPPLKMRRGSRRVPRRWAEFSLGEISNKTLREIYGEHRDSPVG
jgi:hypothetical protein